MPPTLRAWSVFATGGMASSSWPCASVTMFPMEPDRPRSHLRRIEGRNHARSLTFSCFGNRPFLRSERACTWLVDGIRAAGERYAIDIWAWIAMPTHVHLLVYPRTRSQRIGPVLATIKLHVARRAVRWMEAHHPGGLDRMRDVQPSGRVSLRFWQRGGGYDRNLVSPEAIVSEVRYIHQNPVRAGLCMRAEEWKWSSIHEHLRPGAGPIAVQRASLLASIR